MTGTSPGTWSRWSMRAGLVALAVAIALAIALLTAKGIGFDLGSYVLAARRFLAGSSMYPDPLTYAPGPFDQYVYPPPVILVFVPLAVIPFDAARLIWFLLLCAVAIALLVGHEWPTYVQIFQKRLAGDAAGGWNIIPSRFASGSPRLALLAIPLLAAVFGGLSARHASAADAGFRLAIAAAPLASTTAWYPYTLLSLPMLLAVPPAGSWRIPSIVLRCVAWLMMMVQGVPEPERYTTLPFAGLVLLLAVGTVDALIVLRSPHRSNELRLAPTG